MPFYQMETIDRTTAKAKIVAERLHVLTDAEKLKILENNFFYLEKSADHDTFEADLQTWLTDDDELPELSPEAVELIRTQTYLTLPFSPSLDPLFERALLDELYGVANSYLEIVLNRRTVLFEVTGTVEPMGTCPCCRHLSNPAGEDGFHAICPVCFWQDGGAGPNGMLLETAQANVARYGAMSPSALRYVDVEGKIKYERSTPGSDA